MKRMMLALSALVLTVVMAGCGGTPTVPDATAQFCQSLGAYQQSVAALSAIDPNSTVGQLKDAQKKVDQSAQAVVQSAATVKAAKVDEFRTAQQTLQQTINSIPSSATIKDAMVTVAPAAKSVTDAAQQLRTTLSCK